MELPSSELELNCLYRNWNWSRIAFIGIGIGAELPLSELELELNCKNGIDPSSGCHTRQHGVVAHDNTALSHTTTRRCRTRQHGVVAHTRQRTYCVRAGGRRQSGRRSGCRYRAAPLTHNRSRRATCLSDNAHTTLKHAVIHGSRATPGR